MGWFSFEEIEYLLYIASSRRRIERSMLHLQPEHMWIIARVVVCPARRA